MNKIELTKKDRIVLKIAALMISDLADILSNRGCNDLTDEVLALTNQLEDGELIEIIDEGDDVSTNEDWLLAHGISDYITKIVDDYENN